MRKYVLVVEDSISMAALCEEYLAQAGYRALLVGAGQEALRAFEANPPMAVLLDYQLPDMDGLQVLQHLRAMVPDAVVIMMTANATVEHAAAAMRLGAYDFLQKPFSADRLLITLKNALEKQRYKQELHDVLAAQAGQGFGAFIGTSAPMRALYRVIQQVAPSRVPVFITGESGTGKELAAQSIHHYSPRHARPFCALNCGAVPATLLESELFGHVKGAFTGATQDRQGLLQQADSGTLFLDEIAELPLDLQVKLLRAVQTQSFRPVGSDKDITVNVRFVAATNRDIVAEVKAEKFREDLFYRLYVVPLELPPLREREDDVLLLASHFLTMYNKEEKKHFSGFVPAVQQLLRHYVWPGNVRELENAIRYAVALGDDQAHQEIAPNMLPPALQNLPVAELAMQPTALTPALLGEQTKASSVSKPLWLVEREAILQALHEHGEDVAKAAAALEISPSTIYRKLESWRKRTA